MSVTDIVCCPLHQQNLEAHLSAAEITSSRRNVEFYLAALGLATTAWLQEMKGRWTVDECRVTMGSATVGDSSGSDSVAGENGGGFWDMRSGESQGVGAKTGSGEER